jgi:hypothetical protein
MTTGIEREPTFTLKALYGERHAQALALKHFETAAMWRRSYRDALREKRAMEAAGFICAKGNEFDCVRVTQRQEAV